MTDELKRLLAEHVGEVPRLHRLAVTVTGTPIHGFPAVGDGALAWWRRLRAAHGATGYWPLLMDDYRHLDANDACPVLRHSIHSAPGPSIVDRVLADADGVDAEGMLRPPNEWWLFEHGEIDADEVETTPDWPESPTRPGFQVPYGRDGSPDDVWVALVPVRQCWQVLAPIGYGSWNSYPSPHEHVAIMRHWYERYGAEPVALTRATVEYAVSRPPRTRLDAWRLAWAYRAYNAGEYDLYDADTILELAAALQDNDVWIAWWD